MTLTKAINSHLRRDGETAAQLAAELKKLTPEDRAWFVAAFAAEGIEVEG